MILTRKDIIFACRFLLVVIILLPLISCTKRYSQSLVKVEGRVKQKFILIKPEKPIATVILFTGGHGGLGFRSPFEMNWGSENFLVRTRRLFANHGLMVAVIDSPPDRKKMYGNFRMGGRHASDIMNVITYLRNQADIPVWLIGMSFGTFSAAGVAIRGEQWKDLSSRIGRDYADGVVLISSVTRSKRKWKIHYVYPNGIINMKLYEIRVPTLIVSHKDDKCEQTPAVDAPKLKEALENSPKVEVMYFTGGKRPIQEPCFPLSAHGYYGIEKEVVASIADYIKSNVAFKKELLSMGQKQEVNDTYQSSQFIGYENGVVLDTKTGLEWYAGPDSVTTWDETKRWIESLTVAGGGWRLPTIEELETLYIKGIGTHNMTPLLKPSGWLVWSGETTKDELEAFGFSFIGGYGYMAVPNRPNPTQGFAVRSKK